MSQGESTINPENQSASVPQKKPRWKTLESNPDVINNFMHSLGVPEHFRWTDCVGLDAESLLFVPRPCYAVLFLFPISNDLKSQYTKEWNPNGQQNMYFVKQLVGNACGTIALVHTFANNMENIPLDPNKPLFKFLAKTLLNNPLERGTLLGYDDDIADAHEQNSKKGQTRHEDVVPFDFHFVCFTQVGGNLVELDGGKEAPIVHQPTSMETFVEDAAAVIQQNYIAKSKEPYFSVLTLGIADENEPKPTVKDLNPPPSSENVMMLVSMGFSQDQAKTALEICGNDLEQATNYLLSNLT
mmetsp:Transcript_14430/g.20119  ORF Transcript_14430/g.20119 Transcript_14430/m.20119 type:complete len:299 (-) Transcript_14430:25-921(-)